MNKVLELFQSLTGDGITDKWLAEISQCWSELGKLLDSAKQIPSGRSQALNRTSR
jgi:hypothetical protein